ncbi:MAG: hypothetical protein DI529_09700 [Chryseobacterium sp.]|nr:MAG: hypothetical protein DI529_09700 [Chryseobacterium sp.]
MYMKRFYYLFFIVFCFYTVIFGQESEPSKALPLNEGAIVEKLKSIKNNRYLSPEEEEVLLLQLKASSERLKFEKGILLSGDYLMSAYSKQDKNKEIVELADELKKLVQNKKDDPTGLLSNIYRKNALALMYLGLDDASKKNIEKAISFAKTIENPDRKYLRMAESYMDLFSHYKNRSQQSNKKSDSDSTLYFLKKSLEVEYKIRDNNGEISDKIKYREIVYTYMHFGVFYLENSDKKGNLELAEKNLLMSEKIQKKKAVLSTREESVLLNQLSWLYMEKKAYQKSIDYANAALKLEKQQSRPTARVESFEFLATCYTELGDKEKSKYYLQKYTVLKDSINIASRKQTDTTMKKMVANVDEEHQKNSKKQLILIGAFVLIASVVTVILWRRKNKILRRNYDQIIEKLKKESFTQSISADSENEDKVLEIEADKESELSINRNIISIETETRILKRLMAFEKSGKFLRKDFTISALAAQLNTNSKYLSEIIKKNKSQNFNNYINNLRINYIVHKLYNEPKYREYKISYLAEECGYASPQVFVIAFKKINGVTPSYFIDNLKEDQSLVDG